MTTKTLRLAKWKQRRALKKRVKELRSVIQSAYDSGRIEFLDRCIFLNELECSVSVRSIEGVAILDRELREMMGAKSSTPVIGSKHGCQDSVNHR